MRSQARCGDSCQCGDLVIVGRVTGHAHRADGKAIGTLDDHPARNRQQAARRQMRQRPQEGGPLGRHLAQLARRHADRQGARRLAAGNVHAQEAGAVLALEGDDVTARIGDHAGQGLHAGFLALGEGGRNDGVGFFQADAVVGHGQGSCDFSPAP